MSESHWRNQARPIIAAVLSDLRGEPDKVIRKALREAYPFGPMRMHPYRIWRDEIARQMGTKKPKEREAKPAPPPDPRQENLFG